MHKVTWSENAGWMNWRDADGTNGSVIVGAYYLTGHVWSENVGWINVGGGEGPYTNTNGSDFGVNIQSNNDLEGYAWAENSGWINFGWAMSTGSANRARFDFSTGRFRGYAWSENDGWINLNHATHYAAATVNLYIPEPIADPSGFDKNRYLSFSLEPPVAAAGNRAALRVNLVDLHYPDPPNAECCPPPDYNAFVGEDRWVGPPAVYPEALGSPGSGTFVGATLLCLPHFRKDWHTFGLIHVTGAEVIPSSGYLVRSVSDKNSIESPDGLEIRTNRWGDVVAPFSPPDPSSQPDFVDISAIVDKFKSLPTAPIKSRTQLQANVPTMGDDISFLDISSCVDAFKGFSYPHIWGPCECPSAEICPVVDACARCELPP